MPKMLKIVVPDSQPAHLILDELSRKGFAVDFADERSDDDEAPGSSALKETESCHLGLFSSLLTEFESPLTSLLLHTHLKRRLLEQDPLSGTVRQKLKEVVEREERRLQKVKRLVNELIYLARVNQEELPWIVDDFDLRFAIRQAVDRSAPRIESLGSRLVSRLDNPVWGSWNRSRIEQACACLLISMALEFPGRPIEVSSRTDFGWAEITFSLGVPELPEPKGGREQDIAMSSERPVSADGLCGLHTLAKTVRVHGGTLSLQTETQRGVTTVVTARLPVRNQA